jgi:hypothetical protein
MTGLTASSELVQHVSLVDKVLQAVKSLNARYGYGDVQNLKLFLDGRIEFVVKGFQMRPQTRRGQLVNARTVKALRHQMTIENREGLHAMRTQVRTEGMNR